MRPHKLRHYDVSSPVRLRRKISSSLASGDTIYGTVKLSIILRCSYARVLLSLNAVGQLDNELQQCVHAEESVKDR